MISQMLVNDNNKLPCKLFYLDPTKTSTSMMTTINNGLFYFFVFCFVDEVFLIPEKKLSHFSIQSIINTTLVHQKVLLTILSNEKVESFFPFF